MIVEYPIADEVMNSCRYCATIGRFKFRVEMMRGVLPTPDEPTATVTFVTFEGKTYAVTAAHVISTFENLCGKEGIRFEGYFCPAKPGIAILGPFIQPPEDFQGRRPDVAICPVDSRLPAHIGKEAFVVVREGDATLPVAHAMATGFPTTSKENFVDGNGARLQMQCVQAVAEGVGSGGGDQLQFYSELLHAPKTGSLSGMSGGPVMWSTEEEFGLLGFVKEAMDVTPKEGEESLYEGPRVHFLCQRVDYDVLASWVAFVDADWQTARNRINEEITRGQA